MQIKEREKRIGLMVLVESISHIRNTWRLMVKSSELVNSLAMPWQHNDNVLK